MFCIKIAGIPIGIDNRAGYVKRLCRGYEVEGETPDFIVSVTEEEVNQTMDCLERFSYGYIESL